MCRAESLICDLPVVDHIMFETVYQDFESNELEWEHREVELERTIVRLEKQQEEIASAASQVSIRYI